MRYALLAHAPGDGVVLTDVEAAALAADDAAFGAELADRGAWAAGFALADPGTATTVRRVGDRVAVEDGAATSGPALVGLVVVDVAHLDAALDLAARWPVGRLGPIEVRPLRVWPDE